MDFINQILPISDRATKHKPHTIFFHHTSLCGISSGWSQREPFLTVFGMLLRLLEEDFHWLPVWTTTSTSQWPCTCSWTARWYHTKNSYFIHTTGQCPAILRETLWLALLLKKPCCSHYTLQFCHIIEDGLSKRLTVLVTFWCPNMFL